MVGDVVTIYRIDKHGHLHFKEVPKSPIGHDEDFYELVQTDPESNCNCDDKVRITKLETCISVLMDALLLEGNQRTVVTVKKLLEE